MDAYCDCSTNNDLQNLKIHLLYNFDKVQKMTSICTTGALVPLDITTKQSVALLSAKTTLDKKYRTLKPIRDAWLKMFTAGTKFSDGVGVGFAHSP